MTAAHELHDAMEEVRRLLHEVTRADGEWRERLLDSLVAHVFRLGLLREQTSEWGAGANGPFIQETAPLLAELAREMAGYAWETAQRWNGSEAEERWEWLARRRSGIQFLLDLWAGTTADSALPRREVADIDVVARARADVSHLHEEIPPGVPASHWWWNPATRP